MKVGDKVESKNRSAYGKIVKIWWDGTIRVQWDDGSHSLCSIADIKIIKWCKLGNTTVRLKAV